MWRLIKDGKSQINFRNLLWMSSRSDGMRIWGIQVNETSEGKEVVSQLVPSQKKPTPSKKNLPKLNLLVIDDDPLFLRKLRRADTEEHIAVTECASLGEIEAVAHPGVFDVAVVDYYLDRISENLKEPMLSKRLGFTPTILVSQREECVTESEPWPQNIRYYLNKGTGLHAVIDAALKFGKAVKGVA